MEATAEITISRNVEGSSLRRLAYEVDGALLATVTPSRRRADSRSAIGRPCYVRLYTGPDEYDLFLVGNLTDAKALAYHHASAF